MTGIYAWWRRPDNRVGVLMVATGFAWSAVGLSQANAPLVFTIGLAMGPLYLVFVTWLVLVFPDGVLQSRAARWLVIAGFIDVLIIYELGVLLDISTKDMGARVPDNVFAVVHAPGLAEVLSTMSAGFGAIIIAAAVVLTMRQRRAASPVVREASRPVLVTGLVCLSFVSLSLAVGSSHVSDVAHGVMASFAALAFLALPFAYLLGLLRARYARAGTVSDLLGALSSRAALRDTLADALGDPSLRLVYWTGERWVDRDGQPVELPERGVTRAERDGECIGALIHDPAL